MLHLEKRCLNNIFEDIVSEGVKKVNRIEN